MGFLDALFGGDKGPTPKKIADHALLLQSRHGEPARRYGAMEKLLEWRTPEALDALFIRYTSTAAKETSDQEEKEWLADKLAALDAEEVVPAIERHLRRHAQVGWTIRILKRLLPPEEASVRLAGVLEDLDVHFDRQPQRKVELIHAVMDRGSDPRIGRAVMPFLDDTDDTVRIAAGELLARSGTSEQQDALVEAFLGSGDRPRVQIELAKHMAEQGLSVRGRKAEIEPHLPEGYYLTREGVVKRLGASSSAASPLRPSKDGVFLDLIVQPGARRQGPAGLHDGRLRIRTTVAPEGGRANAAIAALVAGGFGLPAAAVRVVSGATSRRKVLGLTGLELPEALARLEAWLAAGGPAGRPARGPASSGQGGGVERTKR